MSAVALDFSFSRPSAAAIKLSGATVVDRYLSWLPNSKVINSVEYNYYLRNGIDVILNWEFTETDALRGSSGGVVDGTEAVRQAKLLGYPKGATINFSFDHEYTSASRTAITKYAVAARDVVRRAGYRMGAYADYLVLTWLFGSFALDDGWQTSAWSGGLWLQQAHQRQYRYGVNVGGAQVDVNLISGVLYTAKHPYVSPPPKPVVVNPVQTGDDEMTVEEHSAVMTAQAIAYALAVGADTFWLYDSKTGVRKSQSLAAYWNKLAVTR